MGWEKEKEKKRVYLLVPFSSRIDLKLWKYTWKKKHRKHRQKLPENDIGRMIKRGTPPQKVDIKGDTTFRRPRGFRCTCMWWLASIQRPSRMYALPWYTILHIFAITVSEQPNAQRAVVQEHSTSAPNERVLRTTQLARLSFNRPSVVLTADVFQYYKWNIEQAHEHVQRTCLM